MDVRSILKREQQLNLIAYFIILALAGVVGMLVFVLLTGIHLPAILPLTDYFVRTLIGGLLLGMLIYLFDQHRRLRRQLIEVHEQLEDARSDVQRSYDRLAFAHYAATVMTSLAQDDGLAVVLRQALDHFDSDAAAVVGDEVTMITSDGVDPVDSQSHVFPVALEAVRAGKPLMVSSSEGAGEAIAVPLRVSGRLQAVACLWRSENAFTDDELDGLGLLGRIVELSMENRQLLDQVRLQLEGTIEALGSLLEDIRPDYTAHALAVATLAEDIAREMGLSPAHQRDIRVAGLLHDVGMLRIGAINSPDEPLTPEQLVRVRQHPEKGADLARLSNFSSEVRAAIATHHERLDGSGYPHALTGAALPLSGRILAVAEVYDSMARPGPPGSPARPEEALREVLFNAGTRYDPRVVKALTAVIGAAPLGARHAAADPDASNAALTPSGTMPGPSGSAGDLAAAAAYEPADDILAAAFGGATGPPPSRPASAIFPCRERGMSGAGPPTPHMGT
jgi:putative nucleotidyltransferase with HDIG domain